MAVNKNSLESLLSTKPKVFVPKSSIEDSEKGSIGNEYTKITVLECKKPGLTLNKWITDNLDYVKDVFEKERIVLFRGFKPLESRQQFSDTARAISGSELLNYTEPSTPRTQLEAKVYTSTEFPQEHAIIQHNEHSYSDHWAGKIFFYCEQPAEEGGQTPVCDSRAVYHLLDKETRRKFEEDGVSYVRNFSNEMDISWKQFFQTENKEEVQQYCKKRGIQLEWKADDQLRTRQLAQGVLVHPTLGEKVWFNQAHLFHYTNLQKEVYEYLLAEYGEEQLPRNAYYGDHSVIPAESLMAIKDAYHKAAFSFDWQEGDLIMLDNMVYSHGRAPFKGSRSILVAMTEEHSNQFKQVGKGLLVDQQAVADSRMRTATHYVNKLTTEHNEAELKYKLAVANRIMAAMHLEEGGISGHISFKVPGKDGLFWVNPFGMLSEEVTPDNLIMVNEDGIIVDGDYPINVAGFCIHATIHKMYPELNCIVHAHSPWGTVFSALDSLIEPVDQNCCMFFENLALYKEYNGPVNEVDDSMKLSRALDGKNAAILANHGAITCGESIETAVMYMVALERACRINILCRQTGPFKLIDADVARMTKEWIANPIGFKIEFDALQRKVERLYPELTQYNRL
jgi:ribulose-5-phosphate 4-epimerase/fuculose-1-phosphate aldolase/alpha-ketoglutarate-dependent taurine dioxygenase